MLRQGFEKPISIRVDWTSSLSAVSCFTFLEQESNAVNAFCRTRGLGFFWVSKLGSKISIFFDPGSDFVDSNLKGFSRSDDRAVFVEQLQKVRRLLIFGSLVRLFEASKFPGKV